MVVACQINNLVEVYLTNTITLKICIYVFIHCKVFNRISTYLHI